MKETERRYNDWAGNVGGTAEDVTCCIKEVSRNWLRYQCRRKRGHGPDGLYCKLHAKEKT